MVERNLFKEAIAKRPQPTAEDIKAAELGQNIVTVIDVGALIYPMISSLALTHGGSALLSTEAGGTGAPSVLGGVSQWVAANPIQAIVGTAVASQVAGKAQDIARGAFDFGDPRATQAISFYEQGIWTREKAAQTLDNLGFGKIDDPESVTSAFIQQGDLNIQKKKSKEAEDISQQYEQSLQPIKTAAPEQVGSAINQISEARKRGQVNPALSQLADKITVATSHPTEQFSRAPKDIIAAQPTTIEKQAKASFKEPIASSETPTDEEILRQRRIRQGSVKK